MRYYLTLLTLYFLGAVSLHSQMEINGQLLYGNEWYELSQDYLKITVDQDGIYKISYEKLSDAGVPVGQLTGADLKMIYFGEEIPIYTTTDGAWGPGDYLLFYGKRNDGELDKQHFSEWDTMQLNPLYSFYTDESTYYLDWSEAGPHLRYDEVGNNLGGNLPPLKEYYYHKELKVYTDVAWTPGAPEAPDVEYSHFVVTEGFGNRMSPTHRLDFTLTDIYTGSGVKPHLKLRTGSNNQYLHIINIMFNGMLLDEDIYNKNRVRDYDFELSINDLKSTSVIELLGKGISDNIIVAHAEIDYPRYTVADGSNSFTFYTQPGSQEHLYEFENFGGSGTLNFVFDVTGGKVIKAEYQNELARFRLPAHSDERKLILVNGEEGVMSPLEMKKYRFRSFDNLNPEYLILTSRRLNNADSLNGINPVAEYKSYRESTEGGSYKTSVINVEDIYDHFGYGVWGHSYALRNFSMYVRNLWPDFKMVFIVGKGLSYINRNKSSQMTSYVPSYGKPGSDNLIFSEGNKSYPYVGVGRLAAQSPEDILNYLDKVRQHDASLATDIGQIEQRMWRKNILHLSGGDIMIQQTIFNSLQTMKGIIENNAFGGHVTTFRKTSTDPVQTSLSQSIINMIDEGVAIMTFFGHSSTGTFDFSIEDPDKYNNQGRYPVIISMGCHSGDIHESVYGLSEDFVLTPNKGAVAFVASSGNAFIYPLSDYGQASYTSFGGDFYGKPIGLIIRDVLEKQFNPINVQYVTLHEQNTLHGDPAVRLFAAEAPDYVVDFSSISTEDNIGTLDPKINVSFDIINLGMARSDSMHNYLVHYYGDNKRDTVFFSTQAPFNRKSVALMIPNPGSEALGKNIIDIFLDYPAELTETPTPWAKDNNQLSRAYNNEGYSFFIFDNSAFPVYPHDFAIVSDENLKLCASSINAFGDAEYFRIELDTTETFDSPFLQRTEMLSVPSLIQWQPSINWENERVYYWRISPMNSNGETKWNTSSFVFLNDVSSGWNQSHAYQWLKDDYETFEYFVDRRKFRFAEDLKEIRVKNGLFRNTRPSISYQTDKSEYIEFDSHIDAGIYISTFDGETGIPMTNEIPALHGSYFSSPWAVNYLNFPYRTDSKEERAKAINFIENVVPEGDYVVVYTIQRGDINTDYEPEEWASDGSNGDPDLMSLLEGYGAQRVRELESGAVPYILVFKKNDPSFAPIEIKANVPTQEIEAEFKILGRWYEGDVTSTDIGPVMGWNKLQWDVTAEDMTQDSFSLNLIGIRKDGTENVLLEDIQEKEVDISMIDHKTYPKLKLNYYAFDDIQRSPPQLRYWRIMYDEKPEVAFDTGEDYLFHADTLILGQELAFRSRVANLCQTDMDSLLVKFSIIDDRNTQIDSFRRFAPVRANSTIDIDFNHSTDNLLGLHEFRVELNPDMDQEEQYHFNNLGSRNFEVFGDNINPVLDVTFDGVRIMDGDIVSPRPLITVTLKDENKFLYVQDKSNFDLAIRKVPDPQSTPVDLNQQEVSFFPADSSNQNLARLEYDASFESGEYILYVQAEDASGNLSGDQTLEIRFRVVEESQISNVLNYPNPFSTSTEFVFTLTGYEVPEVFNIQIMTLSGKIVKEITKEELGPLRIGLNRSQYKWNGTDEYGNLLANGVYLYRVMTSSEGESFDHFSNSDIDSYFKHGFGKLVIMR